MTIEVDDWRKRKRRVKVAKGRSLAVVDTGGPGPAVLLLHGYTDTSRSYTSLARYLNQFRLIIPDLPGHGDSDDDPNAGFSSLVNDMATLAINTRIVPTLVIGHSFGAVLSLELARMKIWPNAKLVTIAGTAWPMLDGLRSLQAIKNFNGVVDLCDPFLDQWYGVPAKLDQLFLQQMRAEAVNMPVRTWHHYLSLIETVDLRAALADIGSTVLSISGGCDQIFDHRHADLLCRNLRNVRDLRLLDQGHNPHWEAPLEVARLISCWHRDIQA